LHYANFIRWSTRLTILPELLWSKWVIWALLDTSKPTRRKCFFDLDVASCSSGAVREKECWVDGATSLYHCVADKSTSQKTPHVTSLKLVI
jgi:hypothetical protein